MLQRICKNFNTSSLKILGPFLKLKFNLPVFLIQHHTAIHTQNKLLNSLKLILSLYIGRFTIIYFVSTLLFSSFYATFLFTLTPTFVNLAKLTPTQPLDIFLFILTLTFLDNDPLNISYPYRLVSIDYKSSFNSLPSTIPTSNKKPNFINLHHHQTEIIT